MKVVGPWGDVVAEIEEEVGVAYAEIDLDALSKVRQNMPVSTHRRTDLYSLTSNIRDDFGYECFVKIPFFVH